MKLKKLLLTILCFTFIISLIPVNVAAGGQETITISGNVLNQSTPYYTNNGNVSNDSTINWNAYFDVANKTLHIKNLNATTNSEENVISVANIPTLYVEVEGTCTIGNTSADSYGIKAPSTNLVLYGKPNSELNIIDSASNSIAINALSITLQYPLDLTLKGDTQATNVKVNYLNSTYNNPQDINDLEISDYNTNLISFQSKPLVHFAPKTDATFPVHVKDISVTSTNMNNVLGDGTVTYTPAAGATPATLILNNATIDQFRTMGSYAAGIFAQYEPLNIKLNGTNRVQFNTVSGGNIRAIYSEKALSIEAITPADTLYTFAYVSSQTSLSNGAIQADGGLTLSSGCGILSPDSARISTNGNYISEADGTTQLNEVTIGLINYSVNLSESGTHIFSSVTDLPITLTNSGNKPTGALSVSLSGNDASKFTLSKTTINNIAVGATDTFKVTPTSNLPAGTYTATVTVSAVSGNLNAIPTQTFNVKFVVNEKAKPATKNQSEPAKETTVVNEIANTDDSSMLELWLGTVLITGIGIKTTSVAKRKTSK